MITVSENTIEYFVDLDNHIVGGPFESLDEVNKFFKESEKWFEEIVFGKWNSKKVYIRKRTTTVIDENMNELTLKEIKEI